jgi:hypothetical protein
MLVKSQRSYALVAAQKAVYRLKNKKQSAAATTADVLVGFCSAPFDSRSHVQHIIPHVRHRFPTTMRTDELAPVTKHLYDCDGARRGTRCDWQPAQCVRGAKIRPVAADCRWHWKVRTGSCPANEHSGQKRIVFNRLCRYLSRMKQVKVAVVG